MKLPKTLRIGPHVYDVHIHPREWSTETDKHGLCDRMTLSIHLCDDNRLFETFIHEVLHAIYYEWNVQPMDDEERTVTQLSSGIVSFFLDNKKALLRMVI